jgi:hypothetical protein
MAVGKVLAAAIYSGIRIDFHPKLFRSPEVPNNSNFFFSRNEQGNLKVSLASRVEIGSTTAVVE